MAFVAKQSWSCDRPYNEACKNGTTQATNTSHVGQGPRSYFVMTQLYHGILIPSTEREETVNSEAVFTFRSTFKYVSSKPWIYLDPPCGWNKCRFQLWLKFWSSPLKNAFLWKIYPPELNAKMPSIRLRVSHGFSNLCVASSWNCYLNGWYVCGPRLQWPPFQSQWCPWNIMKQVGE